MASFDIYQMKGTPELHDFRFTTIEMLKKLKIADVDDINISMYDHVYTDIWKPNMVLEDIYANFNFDRPSDFKGHSLSVSDVIVLKPDHEKPKAYYVDGFGFTELKKFFSKIKEKTPAVR